MNRSTIPRRAAGLAPAVSGSWATRSASRGEVGHRDSRSESPTKTAGVKPAARLTLVVIALLLASCAAAAQGPAKKAPPDPEQSEGITLTVYNQNFVVVRERRRMDLKQGRGSVRFPDVAATIVPETVQFAVPGKPGAARVVEQSYEYDLVSAAKLLDRYIDREIAVVTRDGHLIEGRLLSFDDSQLVLQTPAGVDLVPRGDNVKDVRFSALPEGLLTRPTLVWQLDAKAGGKELVKVSYAAMQMAWRVDYRARVNQAGDRMDLAGWVTVINNTGITFKDARVRLMAGDLNLVKELAFSREDKSMASGGDTDLFSRTAPAVIEKSFAEYHLYELGRTATVKDRSTKQIELLDIEGIPVTRRYTLHHGQQRVGVELEFKNEKKLARGLGVPLPKGPVRVFQKAGDGAFEFVGAQDIDHTPKEEKVRFRLGYAFDLTARRKMIAERLDKKHFEQDFEVRLRNHRKEAVEIDVVQAVNGRTEPTVVRRSGPFTKRDVDTLIFPVTVRPNAEAIVTYTIRHVIQPPAVPPGGGVVPVPPAPGNDL